MSIDPPSKKRGRPSLDTEGHPIVLSVTLPQTDYTRLQRAATDLRMSVQDVIRLAIDRDLSRKN